MESFYFLLKVKDRMLFLKDFHSDAQLSHSHINVSSVRLKQLKSKGGNGSK